MLETTYRGVVVAALTGFVFSLFWYSPFLFGKTWMELRPPGPTDIPVWKMLVAPLRELAVAYVLARLINLLGIVDWKSAARLGFGLWVAFHAVGMAGAALWDNMPWRLAAVHAGDWLGKILLMAVILGAWRKSAVASAPALPG